MAVPSDDNDKSRPHRSPMGIGAACVGILAWLLVLGGLTLHASHQLAGIGFMVAISGAAVAHEGRRVEEKTSVSQKRWGMWINVAAAVAAIGVVGLEVVRRR